MPPPTAAHIFGKTKGEVEEAKKKFEEGGAKCSIK